MVSTKTLLLKHYCRHQGCGGGGLSSLPNWMHLKYEVPSKPWGSPSNEWKNGPSPIWKGLQKKDSYRQACAFFGPSKVKPHSLPLLKGSVGEHPLTQKDYFLMEIPNYYLLRKHYEFYVQFPENFRPSQRFWQHKITSRIKLNMPEREWLLAENHLCGQKATFETY